MPMYRYRCTACGAQEEHLQKFSDPPMEICVSCGGALAKQMTAAAFHLKGGGWYKDLYASSKSGDASKPDATAKTEAPAKTESPSSSDSSAGSSSTGSTSTAGSSSGGGTSGPSSTSSSAA